MSGGRLFQRRLPATGKTRSPTVDSRVSRITSLCTIILTRFNARNELSVSNLSIKTHILSKITVFLQKYWSNFNTKAPKIR